MADEKKVKSFSEQWQEFKDDYIDPVIEYLNPFRDVEIDELEGKDFLTKLNDTADVFSKIKEDKPAILDWCFLGIPLLLLFIGAKLAVWIHGDEKRSAQQVVEDQPLHLLWFWLFAALVLIQALLSYLLAAVCAPLVGLVHFLYPYDADYKNEKSWFYQGENYEAGTIGANRRRVFFNPSTWMMVGFIALGISLLLQGLVGNDLIGAEIFAQAAGPLLMIQTVFTGIAALMLVGAVLGLAHHAYAVLTTDEENPDSDDYPKSAVVEYFKDFYQWLSDHPAIAVPVMILGVGSVLAVSLLIIGYFTGFGLPGVFDFMLPVFQFIGSSFSAGLQGLSGLPGLEFLSGIAAGPGLELAAQIFTIFALVAGTIFAVDTVRRATQTVTEGPVKPDEGVGKLHMPESQSKPGFFDGFLNMFSNTSNTKEEPNHTQIQQQRQEALNAEAEVMAKLETTIEGGSGFTKIMIATANVDFKAGTDGSVTAEIVQGKRVYLDPTMSKNGWTWGAIGPDAQQGWVADSNLRPVRDLDTLAAGHPQTNTKK